ncbi:hypothetical protein FHX81_2253 [Saccharothrix saharensis]|uniref:Uncharacterized protein n=1 Tax=Saccharothrix saharensis TaxID=571190 RepID=A0A543JAU5_9PSEU|nr:hypothetical protein [Saccharothrix saharensis]TQM79939.1 hypothetical protein FHX81_2253 [Saccharothrix saharensis]
MITFFDEDATTAAAQARRVGCPARSWSGNGGGQLTGLGYGIEDGQRGNARGGERQSVPCEPTASQ